MTSKPKRKSLSYWVRVFHTYVSLLGFAALIFFCVTGITLNHAEYFETGGEVERSFDADFPEELLGMGLGDDAVDEVDRLAIVEYLRAEHGLRGAVSEFTVRDEECVVVFKGPAYSGVARIDGYESRVEVDELVLGTWALLDDLHKGRDSGSAWSWVIDVSAVVLIVASFTGLWLLLYVRRRKTPGLWVTLAGTVVLFAVWAVWVP